MTWTYKQSTGEIFHNGQFIEKGYSVSGWASEGCIIMGPGTRRRILDSNDTHPEVVR